MSLEKQVHLMELNSSFKYLNRTFKIAEEMTEFWMIRLSLGEEMKESISWDLVFTYPV